MAGVNVAQRMTAGEFLAQPFGEGPRWRELIDGEVVVNQPTPLHNAVQTRLVIAVGKWIEGAGGRGQVFVPLDVRLDEFNVYAPDISWYSELNSVDLRSQPPAPLPDLAVEVRSPSTWRYDVGLKKASYERHGLPERWLVDTPAEQMLVFRRSRIGGKTFDVALELGRGDVLGSPLLPGFELALDALFPSG